MPDFLLIKIVNELESCKLSQYMQKSTVECTTPKLLNNLQVRAVCEVPHESFESRNTKTLNKISQELRLDFQGRNYAYRFGEPTDIELRNELKIPSPASRPASANTPVRLLRGVTCVCLLSALDRSATPTAAGHPFAPIRQLGQFRERQLLLGKVDVEFRANLRRMPQSMSEVRVWRRAARRLRGDCRCRLPRLLPQYTTIVSREVHCVAQQKPSRGNYLLFVNNKLKSNSYTIRCLRFDFAQSNRCLEIKPRTDKARLSRLFIVFFAPVIDSQLDNKGRFQRILATLNERV